MIKLKSRAIGAALMCAVLLLFSGQALAADWTEFGGSPERLHRCSEEAGAPAQPKWVLEAGQSRSQPVFVGERIYHLGGGYLWVLDAKAPYDASPKQLVVDKLKIAEEPSSSHPTWAGKGVYFGTGRDGNGQYALGYYEASSGRFTFVPLTDEVVSAPLVLANDTVVVATTDGRLHVVRGLSAGKWDKWTFRISSGRVSSSPAPLGPDSFAIGFDSGKQVAAYRIVMSGSGDVSLERLWSLPTDDGVPASFAVENGRLYFSDKSGVFYCVDARTGRVIWKNSKFRSSDQMKTFINNSPAVGKTNVYFTMRRFEGRGKGAVIAFDKETGKWAWTYEPLSGEGNTAPLVWQEAGAVLVADTAGDITAVCEGELHEWAFLAYDEEGRLTATPVVNIESKPARAPAHWDQIAGAGTELTMASGSTGETLLLCGANSNDGRGYLFGFEMGKFVDLALTGGKAAGEPLEPGSQASVTATALYRKGYEEEPVVETTLRWGFVPDGFDVAESTWAYGARPWEFLPYSKKVTLELGKPVEVSAEFTVPERPSRLVMMINGEKNQPPVESAWWNNVVEIPIKPKRPNLKLSEIWYSPENPKPGDTVSASVLATNDASGGWDKPDSTSISWSVDGAVRGSVPVELGPGESKRVGGFKFVAPSKQKVNVSMTINPDGKNPPNETTMEDNTTSRDVPLVLTDLVAAFRYPLKIWEYLTFFVFPEPENRGSYPVDTVVEFSCWGDTKPYTRRDRVTLQPGMNKLPKYEVWSGKPGGKIWLKYTVNPDRSVKETNYQNNSVTVQVPIVQMPRTKGDPRIHVYLKE